MPEATLAWYHCLGNSSSELRSCGNLVIVHKPLPKTLALKKNNLVLYNLKRNFGMKSNDQARPGLLSIVVFNQFIRASLTDLRLLRHPLSRLSLPSPSHQVSHGMCTLPSRRPDLP